MGRPAKYPFADLEIGQCFTIPADEIALGTARVLCAQWSKRLERRFSCYSTEHGYLIERRLPRAKNSYPIVAAPTHSRHVERVAAVNALAARMRGEG